MRTRNPPLRNADLCLREQRLFGLNLGKSITLVNLCGTIRGRQGGGKFIAKTDEISRVAVNHDCIAN
jgi:hypothetical protein